VRRARFEQANTFEDFDCTVSPKLPAAMLCDPAALRWLDAGESVILYRPVGLGKIHVAQALGHQVSGRGGDIRFVKRSRMLADLADGHADRTIGQRMREYTYDHASIVARAVEHLRSRYRAEPDPDRLLGDGLPSTRCSVSPGSRGELHPPAPTDPDVNLSIHPAPVVLITRQSGTRTSGRTGRGTRW
jgi:hypothetical protein